LDWTIDILYKHIFTSIQIYALFVATFSKQAGDGEMAADSLGTVDFTFTNFKKIITNPLKKI
jgi:hypothetical protein